MGDSTGGGGGGGVTMGGAGAGEILANAKGITIRDMTSARAVNGNVIVRGRNGATISLNASNQQTYGTQTRNTQGPIVLNQGNTSIRINRTNRNNNAMRDSIAAANRQRTGRGGETIR